MADTAPWNRYKHIHVRFVPAIHGLQDSRERYPPFPAQAEFKHQATVKINSDQA